MINWVDKKRLEDRQRTVNLYIQQRFTAKEHLSKSEFKTAELQNIADKLKIARRDLAKFERSLSK